MAHCVRCCCWLLVLTLLALTVMAVVVFIRNRNGGQLFPLPGMPGSVDHKYAEALAVALQFFQVQKSGKLVNNEIPWRGDSALGDGEEAGLDLSKGMYDAGDHMKFGFPIAFTATMLSWSVLEYGGAMRAAKQRDSALDALHWIMDYLINAHPSDNVLYIQVGDPEVDHKCWERPETMAEKRPVTKITTKSPGSDVAAETAAAMAAASMVYKPINKTYSSSLLDHAERLFAFADKYRGSYTRTFPELSKYYNSTTYQDELLWAASWLYHATGNQSYLSYATGKNGKEFADLGNPRYFSWDDKRAGTEVLLSRISFFASQGSDAGQDNGLKSYKQTADAVMCILLPDSDTAAFRTRWIVVRSRVELTSAPRGVGLPRRRLQRLHADLGGDGARLQRAELHGRRPAQIRQVPGGLRVGQQPNEAKLPRRVQRQLPSAGAPPRRVDPHRRRHRLRRPGVARIVQGQPKHRHGRARGRAVQERLIRRRAGERDAERGDDVQQRAHRRPALRPPLHLLRGAVLVLISLY